MVSGSRETQTTSRERLVRIINSIPQMALHLPQRNLFRSDWHCPAARTPPVQLSDHSSAPGFFLTNLAFLAAVFARFFSSASSTFGTISEIEPPAFSMAAFADAVT